MRAQDVMTRPSVTLTPDVPIREAAVLLVSHGFTELAEGVLGVATATARTGRDLS